MITQTFMATKSSMHKRSRSDPIPRKCYKGKASEIFEESNGFNLKEIEQLKCLVKPRNKQPSRASEERASLNKEILQLRERLHEEILVRRELDKVLQRKLFLEDSVMKEDSAIPQAAKKLVGEISSLEMEVIYLEKYLLWLYRKMFNRRVFSQLTVEEQSESDLTVENENIATDKENLDYHVSKHFRSPGMSVCVSPQKVLEGSGIFRSHSSLSHRSGCSFRMSPHAKDLYHQSLPLSMLEQADIDAVIGANSGYVSENVLETPNGLSEEMIKYVSSILLKLSDPQPLTINHPFYGKESMKFACPYDNLFMVKSIRRDNDKLAEVEPVLKHYRSLICRLEGVNPKKLNQEEKLAFWINIHNSLVMHAVLVYGAPKSNMKRTSLMLKAAYNVGGRPLNLDTIQTSILNCRLSRPGQRLRFFFPSKSKRKLGDTGKDYALDPSEPLLHFALSSGNFSDPSVRVYTPKNVMLELEAAKEEYIRSNIGITKDNKILIPKLVELYAKDADLCHVGVIEMIENSLPYNARNKILQCQNKKSGKLSIDWIAHDFTFGFLLPKESV